MASSRLQYPEQLADAVKAFSSIPEEAIEKLVSRINNAPLDLTLESLVEHSDMQIDGLPRATILEIFQLCFWVRSVSELQKRPLNDVIAELAPDEAVSDKTKFVSKLSLIANSDKFATLHRAVDLAQEQPRIFKEARFLTDLRPVFVGESLTPPNSFVLFHSLRISFREDGEYKDLFFGMDSADLKKMKDAVERAIAKANLLEEMASKAGFTVYDHRA